MYVSLGKAARELGVTPATVRRWTSIGFLPCVRTAGGHRRIDTRDIAELARAIGDGGHLEARRAREREVETLVQASIDVAGRLDQTELLAEIARQVTRLCACTTCEIMEYLPEKQALRVLAEYDAGGHRVTSPGLWGVQELPVTKRVLEEQTPIVVNADGAGSDPAEVALMRRYGEKSVLMLPLVFRGASIGLLDACDRQRSRVYSAQELRLCRALAGHAAVALRNAQLFSAARDADKAVSELRRRLRDLAGAMRLMEREEPEAGPLSGFAEGVRAAFEATSCVVTSDGGLVGAAAGPRAGVRPAGPQIASAATIVASSSRGEHDVEITLTLPRPAMPGEGEVLELAAVMAAGLRAT
jgi:excisionase family DNA binding protein